MAFRTRTFAILRTFQRILLILTDAIATDRTVPVIVIQFSTEKGTVTIAVSQPGFRCTATITILHLTYRTTIFTIIVVECAVEDLVTNPISGSGVLGKTSGTVTGEEFTRSTCYTVTTVPGISDTSQFQVTVSVTKKVLADTFSCAVLQESHWAAVSTIIAVLSTIELWITDSVSQYSIYTCGQIAGQGETRSACRTIAAIPGCLLASKLKVTGIVIKDAVEQTITCAGLGTSFRTAIITIIVVQVAIQSRFANAICLCIGHALGAITGQNEPLFTGIRAISTVIVEIRTEEPGVTFSITR